MSQYEVFSQCWSDFSKIYYPYQRQTGDHPCLLFLTSLVAGQQVDFEDIHTEGISHITSTDIKYAKSMGRAIKLLATSKHVGDGYAAMVAPFLLNSKHPLFSVNGVFNAIFVKGNVLDSTNLERNLLLSAQLLEKNKKTILALNMSDEAKKEGIDINYAGMSELLGVDVIGVSAHKKENLPALLDAIISVFEAGNRANKRIFSDEIENENFCSHENSIK